MAPYPPPHSAPSDFPGDTTAQAGDVPADGDTAKPASNQVMVPNNWVFDRADHNFTRADLLKRTGISGANFCSNGDGTVGIILPTGWVCHNGNLFYGSTVIARRLYGPMPAVSTLGELAPPSCLLWYTNEVINCFAEPKV